MKLRVKGTMADTSIDERLSFAVITDPAGNLDFLRRAILEIPSREIERTKKSKKQKVEGLEAIFVIGRLVDPLFTPKEAEGVALARRYLQDELDHNREGYRQLNITDIPGLAHHLKHNAPYKRHYEQDTLIPTIERLVGLKKDSSWLNFGEAKDRIVEQYRQMNEIAEKSQIPVYFAADTIFLEQVIPEERWLHWKSLLLGASRQQLIKAVGMTGIDFAVPEYVIEPTMRGKSRFSLTGFEPFQGKVTMTYGMPDELLRQLKESKQKIVIAGKQGLFDKEANPAEHYPGNLLFLERPLSMSFYSFGNEAGVRMVYFLHNNKLMVFPESQINLREMSASAGRPPKQSDAEAAAQMSDMAADMLRVLPILEKQNPELAQKIRKAGFDRPQQLAHIIDFLNNQYETVTREKHDFMMQFVTFLDEIIRHAKLFEWYQTNKKGIYERHGIIPGAPASHAVEMEVFELGIHTAKDALGRREKGTEQAFNRCLASIEEIVDCLNLRDWYNDQKKHLSQKNGAPDESPAAPERVMELYPLAITAIKEELDRRNKECDQLAADAKLKKELETKLAESTQTIAERDTRLSELLETYATLEAQRNQLLTDKESLQKQVEGFNAAPDDALQARLAEITKKLQDRDETIKLQTARLDELGDANENLTERLGRQVEDNNSLQKEKAELDAKLNDYTALKDQLASLENLAKQLKAERPNITAEDVKGIFDAYAAGAKGDVDKVRKDLEELQKVLRNYERQLHTGKTTDEDIQKAVREMREELDRRRSETIAKIIEQTNAHKQKYKEDIREQYEAAKAEFERKLAEKDKKITEYEEAIKICRREIAEQAYALVEQGKYEDGIKEYTRAIDITPENDPLFPKMLVNRGRAHFKIDHYLSACVDFERARAISPTYKNISQLVTTAKECMEKRNKEVSGGQPDGKEAKTITP
jgi:hypothetical protein